MFQAYFFQFSWPNDVAGPGRTNPSKEDYLDQGSATCGPRASPVRPTAHCPDFFPIFFPSWEGGAAGEVALTFASGPRPGLGCRPLI